MTKSNEDAIDEVELLEELFAKEFPSRAREITFPAEAKGSLWRSDIHRPEGGFNWFDDEYSAWIGDASGTVSGTFECLMLEVKDSDHGLSWLRELGPDDVDILSAANQRIRSAELAHIGHLTGLKEARLEGAGITDRSLKHLAPLTGLRSLLLAHAAIRGPGLEHLSGMRELAYLDLSWTRLTDDGLRLLPKLPKLRFLDLRGTAVRDIAPDTFARFPLLEELSLPDSVSPELRRRLQFGSPRVVVRGWPEGYEGIIVEGPERTDPFVDPGTQRSMSSNSRATYDRVASGVTREGPATG